MRKKWIDVVCWIGFIAIALFSLAPLLWGVRTSFTPNDEFSWIPQHPTLEHYENIFSRPLFLLYIKNMLADLIYINSIVATELIKITENTATIRRGEEFLNKTSCLAEHYELSKDIIEIAKKYQKKPSDLAILEDHVLKHI